MDRKPREEVQQHWNLLVQRKAANSHAARLILLALKHHAPSGRHVPKDKSSAAAANASLTRQLVQMAQTAALSTSHTGASIQRIALLALTTAKTPTLRRPFSLKPVNLCTRASPRCLVPLKATARAQKSSAPRSCPRMCATISCSQTRSKATPQAWSIPNVTFLTVLRRTPSSVTTVSVSVTSSTAPSCKANSLTSLAALRSARALEWTCRSHVPMAPARPSRTNACPSTTAASTLSTKCAAVTALAGLQKAIVPKSRSSVRQRAHTCAQTECVPVIKTPA